MSSRLRPRSGRPFAASSGRLTGPAALIVAIAAAAFSLACDGRVREIRARLSDPELLLFDRGQKLSSPCWACHDFYGTQHKIGPHLSGLYGRRAGATDFPGYSDALRQSGIVWTDETLGRFLADPQGLVPGTTMVSPGVRDPADLDALLFYTRQVTDPPTR